MRQSNLCFDPKKDLGRVDQFGFVDLVKAEANNAVPANLQADVNSFDGQEIDPNSIIGKPHDTFEALRMQDGLATDYYRKISEVNNTEGVSSEVNASDINV